MKTRERYSLPLICVICLMVTALAALCAPKAYADEEAVLNIQSVCGGDAVEGIHWQVYRIGFRNDKNGFSINDKFAGSGVTLDDVSEEAVKSAADAIDDFIFDNQIQPDHSVVSGSEGLASVNVGEAGVFFVKTNEADIADYHYTALPAIVEVKADEPAELSPKIEREMIIDDSSVPDESSIPDESSKPEDSSKVEESSVPDDENSRKSEGDGDHGRKTGDDEGEPHPDSKGSSQYQGPLPQTGQLWWPVPVMAIVGMVLVALGLRLRAGKGGKDE